MFLKFSLVKLLNKNKEYIMENKNNKLCILCYNPDKIVINIFDEEGFQLNIADILRKHFWFKVVYCFFFFF